MHASILESVLRQVRSVRAHIRTSEHVRNLVIRRDIHCTNASRLCFDVGAFYSEPLDATEWRVIDHCASVTRLYAVYERYVGQILTAYIAFLESSHKYADLSAQVRDEHRRLLGRVLTDLDKDRYRHLAVDSMVRDFLSCLSGDGSYRILPDALLAHDQNLRLQELAQLLVRCDISDIRDWLLRHRIARAFFREQGRQSDTAEAELRQLVDARNEAAHVGLEIDNVFGPEVLVEFADFVAVLCSVIHERVCHEIVHRSVNLAWISQT
jgi:MAE_28990/MAE_18760-like HEPN